MPTIEKSRHGTELPAGASGLLYSIGFVAATGTLHAVRVAGSWIVAIGLLMLGWSLRPA